MKNQNQTPSDESQTSSKFDWMHFGLWVASAALLTFSAAAALGGLATGYKAIKAPQKKREPIQPYHDYTETSEALAEIRIN